MGRWQVGPHPDQDCLDMPIPDFLHRLGVHCLSLFPFPMWSCWVIFFPAISLLTYLCKLASWRQVAKPASLGYLLWLPSPDKFSNRGMKHNGIWVSFWSSQQWVKGWSWRVKHSRCDTGEVWAGNLESQRREHDACSCIHWTHVLAHFCNYDKILRLV